MENNVENSQIEEFIANLKGRKFYEEKKAIKLGFQILKNMWLTKFQMICRNLQIFVRLLRGKYGAKIKLKQSPLLLVGVVD